MYICAVRLEIQNFVSSYRSDARTLKALSLDVKQRKIRTDLKFQLLD